MCNTIGKKIKELRTLANMSQDELGRRVGVQRAAINKYEKGTVTNIPLHTIERIANTFDVSPNYLVGWDSNYTDTLSTEYKVLTGVSNLFGKEVVDIIETYVTVNKDGKRKLIEYSYDVWKLYRN
jgi:transcriptional regulator with XRE-family HTH domain